MTPTPHYLAKMLDACRDIRPGTVQHVHVAHDDWCAQLRGTGACNCDPDVLTCGLPCEHCPPKDEL